MSGAGAIAARASGARQARSGAPMLRAAARLRVGYLCSQYPSLSHTFIEREVRAVRARGVEIVPVSVRPPGAHGTAGRAHAAAAAETRFLLESPGALLRAQGRAWAARPAGCLRGHVEAQRLSPPGLRARGLHAAYAMEGASLARLMRDLDLRHVHVHMANNAAGVALLACRIDPDLSYSMTIHGSAEFFGVEAHRLRPKAEHARFVRCISDFCRAQVMAWTDPACWDRLRVVRTGVDLNQFDARPRSRGAALRLLAVGRLHPIKGYRLLLRACRALGAAGVPWTLDLVGDGPERAGLELEARRLEIAQRVRFSGAVSQDEIGAHFDAADALVVSSFMEGVPVVLMEAMARGMPVVATAVGGVPELVEHGQSGLLVRAGSESSLALGLKALWARADDWGDLGAAGRAAIERDYSLASTGEQMAALLREHVP